MQEVKLGFIEDQGSFIRGLAGFDNDPSERVGHEHEGVGKTGEVERLQGADIGGRDYK